MNVTIENSNLKISAKTAGAELTSIFNKKTGREMLWQADPQYWGRHAPVLFPFVGKLKDNNYTHNGKTFEMGQHGFARDMDFELTERKDHNILFTLKSSAETKQVYPFEFELMLAYKLSANTLIHSYEIKNKGIEPMLYSIGAHPAYRIEGNFEDYALIFNKPESKLERTFLDSGLLAYKKPYMLKDLKTIPLSHQLFKEDALVFENLQSDEVSLLKNDKALLTMNFEGFPYFGIWTKPGAPFLCLEPWLGLADIKDFEGELVKKKGILTLQPGEPARYDYSVIFY